MYAEKFKQLKCIYVVTKLWKPKLYVTQAAKTERQEYVDSTLAKTVMRQKNIGVLCLTALKRLLLAIVHECNLVLSKTETKGLHKLYIEIQEVCDVYENTP
jgi:hypothetical protein